MSEQEKVKWPIKAWFFFHCVIILLWCLPMPAPAIRAGIQKGQLGDQILNATFQATKQTPLKHYLGSTGLWQYWDMFAPNPLSIDYYHEPAVEFADGSVKTGFYPRIKTMPIYEKYFKERFRKYVERVNQNTYAYLWLPFAKRIAYEAYTNPENPPVRVTLIRYYRKVGPPGNDPEPFTYQEYAFFTYVVDLNQLRREKPL